MIAATAIAGAQAIGALFWAAAALSTIIYIRWGALNGNPER